jgi:hypothetical protein
MKKPGSVDYLREISDAVIDFNARWQFYDPAEATPLEQGEHDGQWRIVVDLAKRIREDLGSFKKGRKRDAG